MGKKCKLLPARGREGWRKEHGIGHSGCQDKFGGFSVSLDERVTALLPSHATTSFMAFRYEQMYPGQAMFPDVQNSAGCVAGEGRSPPPGFCSPAGPCSHAGSES